MKLVDLDTSAFDSFTKIQDFDNMLDVFKDRHGNMAFNLNKTLYVQVDVDRLPEFVCDNVMHWPLVSYRIYGTTRLAWLLQKLNGVTAADVFNAKQPKDVVKYLPQQYVDAIVAEINDFDQ